MASPVVTIFGSGALAEDDPNYQMAVRLGRLLAEQGYRVCNGGYRGIMEASARGAKEAGGKTIGITIEKSKGKVNPWIDEEQAVKNWRDRLFRLIEIADAYVVLDGGTGTLTEFLTVWEMTNQKIVAKPILILGNFSQSLLEHFKTQPMMVFNDWIQTVQDPESAVECLNRAISKSAPL